MNIGKTKALFLSIIMFFALGSLAAQDRKEESVPFLVEDTLDTATRYTLPRKFIHRLGVQGRASYVFKSKYLPRRENDFERRVKDSFSAHLDYSFRFHPNTVADHIYGGVYQGVGCARFDFGDSELMGDPWALYLFQGARIARFNPRLELNYEWNLGISAFWKPYDFFHNPYNWVIGSKFNAYISVNFHLNWAISRDFDLNLGVALTHFSNGNTKFPNAGLNTIGAKLGLVYNFNRDDDFFRGWDRKWEIPRFQKHMSYDVVVFGSWRRKGIIFNGMPMILDDSYGVMGISVQPMYNFGYNFRAGIGLDGSFDSSANLNIENGPTDAKRPPVSQQMALGLSARVEFVMPYFSIGLGLGSNVLYGKGDLDAFYQTLALKVEVTRNTFLHIGYSLHDFHEPNFLMLGLGFRLNNKSRVFHR